MNTYSTRSEAIAAEIAAPLDEYEEDYNVDAIADEVLNGYDKGYSLREDVDFWEVVERHAL